MGARPPAIDVRRCTQCGTCIALCPGLFEKGELGHIQFVEGSDFLQEDVEKAIHFCPAHCLAWE